MRISILLLSIIYSAVGTNPENWKSYDEKPRSVSRPRARFSKAEEAMEQRGKTMSRTSSRAQSAPRPRGPRSTTRELINIPVGQGNTITNDAAVMSEHAHGQQLMVAPGLAYLGVPLPGPTVDEAWRLTIEMNQLTSNIEQMCYLALQQTTDPAVIANINAFLHHLGNTKVSVSNLHIYAQGLKDFMTTVNPVVLVPSHDQN